MKFKTIIIMTFDKKKQEEKVFGNRKTRTIGFRVPEEDYKVIKKTIKEYMSNFKEKNIKKIRTIKDDFEIILSLYLDIKDYIWKDRYITLSKYLNIIRVNDDDLIEEIIKKHSSIKRKLPIKTLKEEKKEKEEKEELERQKKREKQEKQTGQIETVPSKTYQNVSYKTPNYTRNSRSKKVRSSNRKK